MVSTVAIGAGHLGAFRNLPRCTARPCPGGAYRTSMRPLEAVAQLSIAAGTDL